MDFEPTEDQRHVTDSVEKLFSREYDFDVRRRSMSSQQGHDPAMWAAMGKMGLMSLPLPASFGGMDGGALDMVGTMGAMGRALCVEPYLSTILGARVLANCAPNDTHAGVLESVATGEAKLAVAYLERDSRYDLTEIKCEAEGREGRWILAGEKIVVQHAPLADWLLVTASAAPGEMALFALAADAPGVTMSSYRTLDGMTAAHVNFAEVSLPQDALVARSDTAVAVLEEAVDFATVLLCCEALGVMSYANAATLDFLKTRKQFGVAIGSFQVLQHRMVNMTMAEEQARSITYLACAKVDAAARGKVDASTRRRFVSACKVNVSEACRLVANESVQLHGGMGMTEEMKISHAFRRLSVMAQQFGDVDHHLERFSREPPQESSFDT